LRINENVEQPGNVMFSYFYDIIAKVIAAQRFVALALLLGFGKCHETCGCVTFCEICEGCSAPESRHAHSVALFAMYYNFVRIHKTLRTTPAMAAGVTSRLWEIGDIVDVLEAWEAAK
jgi:hypothetical protein